MQRSVVTPLVIIALGLLVAVGPSTIFAVCDHGVQLTNGRMMPMKCHWTAQASIAFGALIALGGVLLLALQAQAARMACGVMTAAVAAAEMLVPSVLIGVCGGETMPCHMVTAPALYFLCGVTVVLGLFTALRAARTAGEARA